MKPTQDNDIHNESFPWCYGINGTIVIIILVGYSFFFLGCVFKDLNSKELQYINGDMFSQ